LELSRMLSATYLRYSSNREIVAPIRNIYFRLLRTPESFAWRGK